MREFIPEQVAGLDCLVRRTPGNKRAIVLLHGYGADYNDLCGLASTTDADRTFDWYFPRGPVHVPIDSYRSGRAWFPIDMIKLQSALMRGDPAPYANLSPDGFLEASAGVQLLSRQLSANYDGVILGGFSQGAMVSCDAALQVIQAPPALLILSGNLVARARWKERMPIAKSMQIFQSHGQSDPILAFAGANELACLWQKYGFTLRFIPFDGGHEIPETVLHELQLFLRNLA